MTCFTSEEKSSHYLLLIVSDCVCRLNKKQWFHVALLAITLSFSWRRNRIQFEFKKYLTLIELQVKMTSGLTFKKYANKAKVITTLRLRPKRENVCFSLAYVINVTIFRTVYYLTEYKTHCTKKKRLSLLWVRSWYVLTRRLTAVELLATRGGKQI
jgi:hypothetical protein